jgi:hypothetical protein
VDYIRQWCGGTDEYMGPIKVKLDGPDIHQFLAETDEYNLIFIGFWTDEYNFNIFVGTDEWTPVSCSERTIRCLGRVISTRRMAINSANAATSKPMSKSVRRAKLGSLDREKKNRRKVMALQDVNDILIICGMLYLLASSHQIKLLAMEIYAIEAGAALTHPLKWFEFLIWRPDGAG